MQFPVAYQLGMLDLDNWEAFSENTLGVAGTALAVNRCGARAVRLRVPEVFSREGRAMSERIVGRLREMALRDPVVRRHLGGYQRGATSLEDALFYTVLDLNDRCARLEGGEDPSPWPEPAAMA